MMVRTIKTGIAILVVARCFGSGLDKRRSSGTDGVDPLDTLDHGRDIEIVVLGDFEVSVGVSALSGLSPPPETGLVKPVSQCRIHLWEGVSTRIRFEDFRRTGSHEFLRTTAARRIALGRVYLRVKETLDGR